MPHGWSFLALTGAPARSARAWEQAAARWTNTIVAVGDAEAALARTAGVNAPVHVVHNPVPSGWGQVPWTEAQALRQELGLGAGPLVVCVGRRSYQKGHDQLLEAWRGVHAAVPAARLLLVGYGSGPGREVVDAARGVHATGLVEARPYVGAADFTVLPSRWEGCALAMLESLASGRAVVMTDVGGSEVVTKARAGAVVPLGATRLLAEAIRARLESPELARLEGERGARYTAKHHDGRVAQARLAAVIARAHVFGQPGPGSASIPMTRAALSSHREPAAGEA
jgi:glycosyltransferase involved in cell wall biosynthesis